MADIVSGPAVKVLGQLYDLSNSNDILLFFIVISIWVLIGIMLFSLFSRKF